MKEIRINANSDGFARFANSIKKFDILTPDEEFELIRKYKNTGDESAKTRLIECNQRYVLSFAKKFSSNPDDILDFVDEGNIGLMIAIDKFDETRGFRLMTFAKDWIICFIRMYINENVRVKRSNNLKIGTKVEPVRNSFFVTFGREATDEEVAEIIERKYNIPVKNLSDVSVINYISINKQLSSDDETKVEDVSEFAMVTASRNEYEKTVDNEYLHSILDKFLLTLNTRDRKIMKMLAGFDYDRAYSADEIADELGLTKTRVLQIIRGIQTNSKNKSLLKLMC